MKKIDDIVSIILKVVLIISIILATYILYLISQNGRFVHKDGGVYMDSRNGQIFRKGKQLN
jgi:hypothetical protein